MDVASLSVTGSPRQSANAGPGAGGSLGCFVRLGAGAI
ncbi:hypothetical protein PAMC26577_02680 [Caballeronia sordidicola]|uniref:Uncharacterized protein n=1 Tax=Caballeronia sordidicola TaxID=196367 RepID=A0A242N5Z3_CABSO|nr:hypothetical protein PAMC26577_02680 [Caballeronia sordidicola]